MRQYSSFHEGMCYGFIKHVAEMKTGKASCAHNDDFNVNPLFFILARWITIIQSEMSLRVEGSSKRLTMRWVCKDRRVNCCWQHTDWGLFLSDGQQGLGFSRLRTDQAFLSCLCPAEIVYSNKMWRVQSLQYSKIRYLSTILQMHNTC